MQLLQERGAAVAPNRPWNHPQNHPPPMRARATPVRLAAGDRLRPGGGVKEFFAYLGPDWPLASRQRRRLAPAVAAALAAGWAPAVLATFVGANTAGIRNRAAVLAARLSPAELPPPPGQARARPPWCGADDCDERTRRLQRADGADAGRCRVLPSARRRPCRRSRPRRWARAPAIRRKHPSLNAGVSTRRTPQPGLPARSRND